MLEYVVAAAPPEETVPGIAIRLLNINFASIHTSWDISMVLISMDRLIHDSEGRFSSPRLCLKSHCYLRRMSTAFAPKFRTPWKVKEGGPEMRWLNSTRSILLFEKLAGVTAWCIVGPLRVPIVYMLIRITDGLPRLAMVATDLGDGTFIPPGHRVAIDMKAIHYNPETYPDPEKCDLFRFSKLREKEGVDPNDTKYGFSTIDSHVCLSL